MGKGDGKHGSVWMYRLAVETGDEWWCQNKSNGQQT